MNSDTTVAEMAATESDESKKPATPDSTRRAIVKSTGGGYAPVRHEFVQKHDASKNRSSTLGKLVREHKRRELILYLLVITSWVDDATRSAWPAAVWKRALTVDTKPQMTWSASTLSETWTSLVNLGLVTRTRERRRSRITPRCENGRTEYTRPDGRDSAGHYFTLPGQFWTEVWFDRLSLAALAVLLVLLKETNKRDEIHLTHAQTAKWYGMSESTAKKGYKELEVKGLVIFRDEVRRSNYAAEGLTTERYYSLTGPFSTSARETVRNAAAAERDARLAPGGLTPKTGVKK